MPNMRLVLMCYPHSVTSCVIERRTFYSLLSPWLIISMEMFCRWKKRQKGKLHQKREKKNRNKIRFEKVKRIEKTNNIFAWYQFRIEHGKLWCDSRWHFPYYAINISVKSANYFQFFHFPFRILFICVWKINILIRHFH